ncbi:hypothetical protein [Colwellia sp. 12G3]|uniref:hypothetical protein n=1 Tax=Colwellia sp. 12G3 TaxID=2058299 RepID=UPI000C33FE2E|nr:hypothetical protein [Colwellia sp. 12G3]PKI14293.1 hypothetical protein CXF71_17180 [Colwellia sp. 12G3]
MNSIKVLLISFTLTFITLIFISPANASPTAKVQHLNVSNTLTSTFNNYDIINVVSDVPHNLSTNYRNNLSTRLFFSNPAIFSEKHTKTTIDVINKSNDFFTTAMVFNDKLHQLISYFTVPSYENITESALPTSESKVIKEKCKSNLNFS